MSVQDVIKKSVLESGVFDKFDVPGMLTALAIALLLGGVIYLVYRKFYVGVIFSRSFAITLVGMTVLTCMVTLAISTNIVISLGMVGALSIVRFRTAVKDPMDLLYLFWAITTGITAGAGMYVLAVLAAVIMIVMIYLESALLRLSRMTEQIRMAGKTQPTSIPAFKLSPEFCVTVPTMYGPMEPPRSPAMASNANIAVPPSGILPEVMLIVPGHMIPTENPHTTQPMRFRSGFGASAARR